MACFLAVHVISNILEIYWRDHPDTNSSYLLTVYTAVTAHVLNPIYPNTFFFFFSAHFHFPASGQAVVTGIIPSPPRFLPSIFYRAEGSAIPLLVDCSSNVANSRSRAFRKSISPQEEVPTNLYEYALGGARTHETDLYQARG